MYVIMILSEIYSGRRLSLEGSQSGIDYCTEQTSVSGLW